MALLAKRKHLVQFGRAFIRRRGGVPMPLAAREWGSQLMNLESTGGKFPLVLLVDPFVTSRHFMWRALSRAFGVLEAGSAEAARAWIATRPDIDAVVVQDELPDQRGLELVRGL